MVLSMAKEAQLPEKTASQDHGTKRLKHAPILEEDRISTLPDSILLTILSSFPTKDAIKTGVLSKRWAYLWTSVPSLSFTDTSYENMAAFATAVLLHRAPKLTNFSVKFEYRPELKPRVDLWLRFATTAKGRPVYVYHLVSHLKNTHCRSISTPMSLFLKWILVTA